MGKLQKYLIADEDNDNYTFDSETKAIAKGVDCVAGQHGCSRVGVYRLVKIVQRREAPADVIIVR